MLNVTFEPGPSFPLPLGQQQLDCSAPAIYPEAVCELPCAEEDTVSSQPCSPTGRETLREPCSASRSQPEASGAEQVSRHCRTFLFASAAARAAASRSGSHQPCSIRGSPDTCRRCLDPAGCPVKPGLTQLPSFTPRCVSLLQPSPRLLRVFNCRSVCTLP